MAFEPINTQEEFNAAIADRLKRERETLEKQFTGYEDYKAKAGQVDSLQKQLEQVNAQLAKAKTDLDTANQKMAGYPEKVNQLTSRAKAAERYNLQIKVAHESGLPFELAAKLSGETEDEMRTDAQNLAPFVTKQQAAPLFQAQGAESAQDASYKSLLNSLKGN